MKPQTRLIALASMATLLSVGMLLACAGDGAKPAAGVWTGSDVSFNVSEDGTKITSAGSTLQKGASLVARVELTGNKSGIRATTAFVYVDIPINDGKFSYSSGALEIEGELRSPTEASGTYRLLNQVLQPSASAMVTDTITGAGEWSALASAAAASGVGEAATVVAKLTPAGGSWSGEVVSMNVSEDGTKITGAGSTLDEGASLILRIRLEPNEFGMSAQTRFLYDDIPIREGVFSYQKEGLEVSGTWQSPTEVSGSYRLVDAVQQPTAWGMTTGTVRGSGEWSTTQVEGGN